MTTHRVVSREEWVEARRLHLAREKEFTRLRDRLSQERRELPWEKVDKRYVFEGPKGEETLADLFEGRHQLVVYHFMFDPSWEEGCKSCSFWIDNLEVSPSTLTIATRPSWPSRARPSPSSRPTARAWAGG
jgi:predicted dithiol-disulfide oxidoreductase (DUF899 family)